MGIRFPGDRLSVSRCDTALGGHCNSMPCRRHGTDWGLLYVCFKGGLAGIAMVVAATLDTCKALRSSHTPHE